MSDKYVNIYIFNYYFIMVYAYKPLSHAYEAFSNDKCVHFFQIVDKVNEINFSSTYIEVT